MWPCSSIGQSKVLITPGFSVQVRAGPPKDYIEVSQMAEKTKNKIKRLSLPANTCPQIDEMIKMLEQLRTANEILREASVEYHRQNTLVLSDIEELEKENDSLKYQNANLQLTREYIDDVKSGAISIHASTLIDITIERDLLKATNDKLKAVQDVLDNVLAAVAKITNRNRLNVHLSTNTRKWLVSTECVRKEHKKNLILSGLDKLTEAEKLALAINLKEDEDEDEDA